MLVWFRNDLRIDDNPALTNAFQQGCRQAIFIKTPRQWQQHNWSSIKIDLLERHLALLQEQLSSVGVSFTILTVDDFAQQAKALRDYCSQHRIDAVFANEEIEVNERTRDQLLVQAGLNLKLTSADCILPPGSVLNKQGEMFKVFSPFRRAWLQQLQLTPTRPIDFPVDIPLVKESGYDGESSKWPRADTVLNDVVSSFIQSKVINYKAHRDFPGIKGTSGLSPYLALGAISARRLYQHLMHYHHAAISDAGTGAFTWLSELAWRDFYRHLLVAFPRLSKEKSFNPKYDGLLWPDHSKEFEMWKAAKTGFPIIDAAMRQLHTTGWMHNRLRMIVASFLTKNLLVNWRLGERYFMTKLIDGDLAANNGGWQWSAGTGCDAQPYFRVFNPISQSKKFDPDGGFIRKYLPELKNVPDKFIHEPYEFLKQKGSSDQYWPPMVDLKSSRAEAIEFYK
jgi:deoxyribodipyrimidine photo-lyase